MVLVVGVEQRGLFSAGIIIRRRRKVEKSQRKKGDMAAVEEGWHTLPDGLKLYTKTWKVCHSHLFSGPHLHNPIKTKI